MMCIWILYSTVIVVVEFELSTDSGDIDSDNDEDGADDTSDNLPDISRVVEDPLVEEPHLLPLVESTHSSVLPYV